MLVNNIFQKYSIFGTFDEQKILSKIPKFFHPSLILKLMEEISRLLLNSIDVAFS